MAASMDSSALLEPATPTPDTSKPNEKEPQLHHALTPPASDQSRDGDGSRKDLLSENDGASSSSLSDIDFNDDFSEAGERLGTPEPTGSSSNNEKMHTPETEGEAEDIYANVKPDRVEGGVPVFCPTMEQFRDFQKYMTAINPYGMKSGIALVDPPEEWKQERKSLDEKVKEIKVKNPIAQAFNGTGGFWTQENMERMRTYNLPQWKALCEQSEHQPPAQRGTARAGTRTKNTSGGSASRARANDSSAGQKRKAGKPRVDELKEEATGESEASVDSDSVAAVSAPASPTPEDRSEDTTAENTSAENGQQAEEVNPIKPRGRPGRKPGSKSKGKPGRKPGSKSGTKSSTKSGGGGSKKTSVASRRMHNQQDTNVEVDEESFKDFDYHLAEVDDYDDERCAQLEQQYWKSLTFAPPMYGADMPGSLFDDETKVWNVAKLPNILDLLDKAVPGVNTAYLYLGMWKATFAWHLEDVDLYSINYIHFGAPKQWYSISQADASRFEKAMKTLWPNDSKFCSQFLRHKTYLISPTKLLNDYGIKVNKIVHREGQFMITYPYGYHSGFNYGYNCAESVNFALEEWLAYALTSQKCNCAEDSVFIDVHDILRKLHPEDYVEEYAEVTDDDEDENDIPQSGLPTPPGSVKAKPGRKRKRQEEKAAKPAKKTKRIKITRGFQPCLLCPNNYDFDDLIMTSDGKLAHRKCATYTTETYIIEENGRDVVYGIENIDKGKWALQCNYCRQKKGVCFQCHTPKCTRAYHATCAVMAGVQVDEVDTPRFYEGVEYKDPIIDLRCKTHRTVKLARPSTDSALTTQLAKTFSPSYAEYVASMKVKDVIQFQVSQADNITAAVVLRVDDGSGQLYVRTLGQNHGDNVGLEMYIDISWLMFVDANNSTIPRCSANAKDMPKWLADKLLSEPDKVEAAERLPAVGDAFIEGTEPKEGEAFFLKWDAFQNHSNPENPDQKNVDVLKENKLWYFMGPESTNSKARYCADPTKPLYDARSDFMSSLPQPPKPVMPPPMSRQSLPPGSQFIAEPNKGLSQAAANAAARAQLLERHRLMMLQKQTGKGSDGSTPTPPKSSPITPPVGAGPQGLNRQQQFIQNPNGQHRQATSGSPTPPGFPYQQHGAGMHPQFYPNGYAMPPQYASGYHHNMMSRLHSWPIQPQQKGQEKTPSTPKNGQMVLDSTTMQFVGYNANSFQPAQPNPSQTQTQQPENVNQSRVPQPPSSSSPAAQQAATAAMLLQKAAISHAHPPGQSYGPNVNQNGPAHGPASNNQPGQQHVFKTVPQPSFAPSPYHPPPAPPAPSGGRGYLFMNETLAQAVARIAPPYQSVYNRQRQSAPTVEKPPAPAPAPTKPGPSVSTENLGFAHPSVEAIGQQGIQAPSALMKDNEEGSQNGAVQNQPSSNKPLTQIQPPISSNSPYPTFTPSTISTSITSNAANPPRLGPSAPITTKFTGVPASGSVNATAITSTTPTRTVPPRPVPAPQPTPRAAQPSWTLEQISERIHTPGGLRLIAETVDLGYGKLANDLQLSEDGTRKRLDRSKNATLQEWIRGINEEEEQLLKTRLKKIGIL